MLEREIIDSVIVATIARMSGARLYPDENGGTEVVGGEMTAGVKMEARKLSKEGRKIVRGMVLKHGIIQRRRRKRK